MLPKKSFPSPCSQRLPLCFFQKFYSFSFCIEACDLFWSNFYIWCEVWVEVSFFFFLSKPNCASAFYWNNYHLSLSSFDTFVEDQWLYWPISAFYLLCHLLMCLSVHFYTTVILSYVLKLSGVILQLCFSFSKLF